MQKSPWAQFSDVLKRESLSSTNARPSQLLREDYYSDALQPYNPLKDFSQDAGQADASYALDVSEPLIDLTDVSSSSTDLPSASVSNEKHLMASDRATSSPETSETDTHSHKHYLQQSSNHSTPKGNAQDVDKRQASTAAIGYAASLKNMALDFASHLNNFFRGEPAEKEKESNTYAQNKTKKKTGLEVGTEVEPSHERLAEQPAERRAEKSPYKGYRRHYEPSKLFSYDGYDSLRSGEQRVPMEVRDELLADAHPPAGSLLGRRLSPIVSYAPTNHFHVELNKADSDRFLRRNGLIDANDDDNKSYEKRVVGDKIAHQPLLGFHSAHHEPGKTVIEIARGGNDAHFVLLVMGLCAAASAMVLAAGLFAFRLQQSRKARDDDEPPTYGVVGPNSTSVGKASGNLAANYLIGAQAAAAAGGILPADNLKQLATLSAARQELNAKLSSADGNGLHQVDAACLPVQREAAGARAVYLTNQNAAMYHYQHQKQQMISGAGERNASQHTSASDLDSEDENDEESYTVYECPGLASAHNMEIKNPLFNDDQTPVNSPSYTRKD